MANEKMVWGKQLAKEGVYKMQATKVTFDINKYGQEEIQLELTYSNEETSDKGTVTQARSGEYYVELVERHCYQWDYAKLPESPDAYRKMLLERPFSGQLRIDAYGNPKWYI